MEVPMTKIKLGLADFVITIDRWRQMKTLTQAWKASKVQAAYVTIAGYRTVLVNTDDGYEGFVQWNVEGKWESIKSYELKTLYALLRVLRHKEEELIPYTFFPVWTPLQEKEW